MRFQADHDLHIHSCFSPCADYDKRQTKEAILAYGLASGLKLLCVTDHLWDEKYLGPGLYGHTITKGKEILPLPQSRKCRFLFGMEVDMDYQGNIGITKEEYDHFDFLVFAPGHLHMDGCTIDMKRVGDSAEEHKGYYLERLYQILDMNLPFAKCGLAHFTDSLVCTKEPRRMFELFSDEEFEQLFGLVAKRGMGIELNFEGQLNSTAPEEWEWCLRPYRIAKEAGCKFYLGSDAHTPERFAGRRAHFEQVVDLLDLKETDKFPFVTKHLPMETQK